MNRRRLLQSSALGFAGALAGGTARAAEAEPSATLAGLDLYIQKAMGERQIPGMSVCVVRGAETLHARGYGVRDTTTPGHVDENTLFQIGSTSKAFTTAALGILVDEKTVGWDDPVRQHLPDFELCDPWVTRNVTVRDAVCHRSGFMDWEWPGLAIVDANETVRRMKLVKASGRFRDSYNYSNNMIEVAGKVIEAVSGVSWKTFVDQRLLKPLGMPRSASSPDEIWDQRYVAPTFFGTVAEPVNSTLARVPNVAMPHTRQDGPTVPHAWQSYAAMEAAGAIVSSVADLSRWLKFHLNGGVIDGHRILQAETLAEIHSAQNLRAPSPSLFDAHEGSYAMGWSRDRYRGELLIHHAGGILDFPAFIAMMPSRNIGLAILANGQDPAFRHHFDIHYSLALWIFDSLIGAPKTDWCGQFFARQLQDEANQTKIEDALVASRPRNPQLPAPLQDFAGTYADPVGLYGTLSIAIESGELVLRFPGEGAYSAKLEPWRGTTFRIRSNGVRYIKGFVDFARDPAGKVLSLKTPSFGADVEYQRI